MKTYMAHGEDVVRKWYVVDAEGVPLGRQGTPEEVFSRPKSEKTRAFLQKSLEEVF